jgi:mannosyltransferase
MTNVILVCLSVGASVALLPWVDKSVYLDEGATLYSIHLSWAALWQQSRVVDLVLLPYYSVLHVWSGVSDNLAWLRFLSVVAFGLTIFLTGHLASRLVGRVTGIVVAILVATNPLMILAALSARPYTLSALLATASVAALLRWLDGTGARWMVWFCVACIGTLLFQLFSVLVPLSALLVAVAVRPQVFRSRWRELVAPISFFLLALLAFTAFTAPQQSQIGWIAAFDRTHSILSEVTGPAAGGGGLYVAAMVAIIVLALAVIAGAWVWESIRPSRHELDLLAIILAWAALPTIVLVAVSFVKAVYVDRYVTASAPGLALFVGLLGSRGYKVAADRWPIRQRAFIGGAAFGTVMAVIIIACSVPAARAVTEDLRGASRYLVVHVKPGDEIALPDHSIAAGINYYLHREHATLASWPQLTGQHYIERFDLSQSPQMFATAPSDIWLADDGFATGTEKFLTELGDNGYVEVTSEQFTGVQVVHLRRSPD